MDRDWPQSREERRHADQRRADSGKTLARWAQQARSLLGRLGPTGLLAGAAAVLPLVGLAVLLGTLRWLMPWLSAHPVQGLAIYIAGVAVLAGLALMPTHANSALGGWAFGFAAGFPAALAGLTAGSLVAYLLAGRASGRRLRHIIEAHPSSRAVHRALMQCGFRKAVLMVVLIRLWPFVPFAVTNVLLASARVRPGAYALGTLIGIAPRTAIVAFAAAGLEQLDVNRIEEGWPLLVMLAIGAAALATISYLARRTLTHLAQQPPEHAD